MLNRLGIAGGFHRGPDQHHGRGYVDPDFGMRRFEAQALEMAERTHSAALGVVVVQRAIYEDAERQQYDRGERADHGAESGASGRRPSAPERALAIISAIHLHVN